jgi:hypothetical protein
MSKNFFLDLPMQVHPTAVTVDTIAEYTIDLTPEGDDAPFRFDLNETRISPNKRAVRVMLFNSWESKCGQFYLIWKGKTPYGKINFQSGHFYLISVRLRDAMFYDYVGMSEFM